MKTTRGKSWDDIEPKTGGKNFSEVIDIHRFTNDWEQFRLFGPVYEIHQHWIPTIKKAGAKVSFPRLCLHNLDDNAPCPYCECGLKRQTVYLTNAIVRSLQEDEPRKKVAPKKGQIYKDPSDKVWTPVRVVQFPSTVAATIISFKDLNKVKVDGTIKRYAVSHKKYGCDLSIRLDKAQSGSGMYTVQREADTRGPLTDDELAYLQYNIEALFDYVESYEEAVETIRHQYNRGCFDTDDDDEGNAADIASIAHVLGLKIKKNKDIEEDEDDEDTPKKSSKKSKVKSTKMPFDNDEDDLDDFEEDNDDINDIDAEEEDTHKKKAKLSKKSIVEDEDEDEEADDLDDDEDIEESEDEEDEDDEDIPKKSSKKEKTKSSKNKKKVEDDEDDDLDDLDDDDLDDLDDDNFEDDDDEEEKPVKKSKKSSKGSRK